MAVSELEIHRLDRSTGTAEPISTREGLVVPDVAGIVEVFRAAKTGKGA